MRDDDDDGSGLSSILYYEMGRDDGERSARSRQNVEEYRDRQAGLIKVNQSDWNVLVTNRDALYQHVLSANDEIDKGNAIIRQMSDEVAQIKGQVNFYRGQSDAQRAQLAATRRQSDESRIYYLGLTLCLETLLKASEQGRTHLPEYDELKRILEEMRDAWDRDRTRLFASDRLGPHIGSLIRILDPSYRP